MRRLQIGLLATLLLAACGTAAPAAGPSASASSAPPSTAAPASRPAVAPAAASKPDTAASAAAIAAASAKPAAAGLAKVNVGFGQLIAQYWPLWVAKDYGIYAANGLDVDQRNIAASTVMAALLSGQVDVVVTGGSELLNGIANGADLVTVANLAPVITQRLEVGPNIKSKEDLVGKKLGISRFGSTTDTNTRDLLERIGLNPNRDVSYVQLDTAAGLLAGLIAGSIDGTLMSPPQTITAEKQGFHPLYELADFKLPATGQIVVMPRAYLSGHRPQAQAFVDSLLQGLTRIREDKPAAIPACAAG
jgi:NitT/TauT family transport system substrate-binding protein